jgi:epoxyqueuosine reductase
MDSNLPGSSARTDHEPSLHALTERIRALGRAHGFSAVGFAATEVAADAEHLRRWLALGRHGEMQYMSRHASKRSRPDLLVEGTRSVICVRMDYWPAESAPAWQQLGNQDAAYIARYALGRDYHKLMRRRLQSLANAIAALVGDFGYRVFVDSAPVLEKALARNSGLGWIGKHTNLISREGGSWFFLGEIYTDMALPPDGAPSAHCGSCSACIDVCPTRAIVAPFELDARRCIAYLTIEHKGSIPVELRSLMGNRIFGCDDCQLVCPWNKYAKASQESDFSPRHNLDRASLLELFAWREDEWDAKTRGSALRRAGFAGWLRNIAVALGNAPHNEAIVAALRGRFGQVGSMVAEHIGWALDRQLERRR